MTRRHGRDKTVRRFLSVWDSVGIVFAAICKVAVRPNGGRSLAGGCALSVQNTAVCTWNGQVETDSLRRYTRCVYLFPSTIRAETAGVSAL